MRATVEFEITGQNHNELIEKSLQLYREYMNNQEVKLPPTFHMLVNPETRTEQDGTGTTVIHTVGWTARVTVPLNNSNT